MNYKLKELAALKSCGLSHSFRLAGALCVMSSIAICARAADDVCSKPEIVISTGENYFCPGVSTVTITAAEGELISFTTGYDDEPSTDIADAVAGPVVISLTNKTDYCIKAVALSETKDPGQCAVQEAWPLTPSGYENYQRLYVAKATGIVPGPFFIYAIEKLRGTSKYWMVLCSTETPAVETSMIVELTSRPAGLNVGEIIDYVNVKSYHNQTTPASGGMKLVTGSALPPKSFPCKTGAPQLEQVDGAASYGQDFWIDHWRVPVAVNNIVVAEVMIYDEVNLLVADKFADIRPEFEQGVPYNIRGFAGTDVSDSHKAMRFFVLSYEKAEQETIEARSISEAFDFESGTHHTVIFACDLTVVTLDRERTHLFAADSAGSCVVITGDFSESDLQPGDIIRDFRAVLSKSESVCYAAVSEPVSRADFGEEVSPLDIDAADLAEYLGRHVRFESAIERLETAVSRAAALPEIRVGGVRVNPSAISDGTAETIGYAVNDYGSDEKFKFRGFVMPDGEGGQEFWPVEILELSGNKPTGLTDAVTDDDGIVIMRDGRPLLVEGQEMLDLLGRPADTETAQPGLYIVRTPNRAVKVVIR